jgi:hypothetical protein
MIKIRRLVASAVVVLALAGCSDSTHPEPGLAPGMRFQYSGLRTGQFSAQGALGAPTAAYALDLPSWGQLWIIAYTRVSPGMYDDVRIDVRNAKVGTYTCSAMNESCDVTNGWVGFSQLDDGGEATEGGNVRASSVRVTISSLSQDTVKGTFEMQMSGWVGGKQGQLTVKHGEFNVPITRK